ncbi:MAG TPA: hypothetical protein VJQ52_07700 [Steroidobacteraceae bacterium]|nr:hypothetical protein [Steroidobacteraceae bacterium]
MHPFSVLLPALLALAACAGAPHRAEFSHGYPVQDCPDALDGQVKLQVEARSIPIPASAVRESTIPTTGAVGRRLIVAVTPAGLRAGDRIIWSTLTVASFGGTFLGWDRLQTQLDSRSEVATATVAPGEVKVVRAARGQTDLTGMYSIDVLLMPGGVAVDDTTVRIPRLWRDDGTPVPATEVMPQLMPVRHPPGLDTVEASFELTFVVRLGKSRDEWTCSAQARGTLVDRDAVRQPFWDVGLAPANAARREWLALFDPAMGGVRLVFDSPAAATAFTDWMRATRSTRVGRYDMRVFRQSTPVAGRPFGSVSPDALQTLRPLVEHDLDALTVGPVGEL